MIPYIDIMLTLGGKTLTVTHTTKWRLVAISGIEAVDIQPYIEDYASRDGGWYGGAHVPPRYITLTVECKPRKDTEEARREMIAFLNPRAEGALIITRSGVTRKIDVRMAAGASFNQPNIRQNRLAVTIQLVAPDPYWKDVQETEFQFLVREPLLNFPFSPVSTAGLVVNTDAITINNPGDVPAGIVCELVCTGGSTVNPSVNCNGKFVKALLTLTDGDDLVIDTRAGHKSILKNGARANVFSADSEFFQIPVGESSVSVGADSGISYCNTSLRYSFGYLGV